MANPFLVLGGIAISVATAAFGIVQVPGWVSSAQDAGAMNELSIIRAAQAEAVTITGSYAPDVEMLSEMFNQSGAVTEISRFTGWTEGWCAIVKSPSGAYFAATNDTTSFGKGATAAEAGASAGSGCDEAPTLANGTAMRFGSSDMVWLVENGKLRHVMSWPLLMELVGPEPDVLKIEPRFQSSYQYGPAMFVEGKFVTFSGPEYYVSENGKFRKVVSPETLLAMAGSATPKTAIYPAKHRAMYEFGPDIP